MSCVSLMNGGLHGLRHRIEFACGDDLTKVGLGNIGAGEGYDVRRRGGLVPCVVRGGKRGEKAVESLTNPFGSDVRFSSSTLQRRPQTTICVSDKRFFKSVIRDQNW